MTVEQRSSGSKSRLLLERLVTFLRGGQPHGAPVTGYNSVLALMQRRVTDDEISDLIADFAHKASAVTEVDIGVGIVALTGELPAPGDVDRVIRRLLKHGWIAR